MKREIKEAWVRRIRTKVADDPARSAAQIERDLKRDWREKKVKSAPPAYKTVQRLVAEARELNESELARYRTFSWPNSMGDGIGQVPWEASRACLELLAEFDLDAEGENPTNEVMELYWRVTQATGEELPTLERLNVALRIAICRRRGDEARLKRFEKFLVDWHSWQRGARERGLLGNASWLESGLMAPGVPLEDADADDDNVWELRMLEEEVRQIQLRLLLDHHKKTHPPGAHVPGTGGILDPANWKTENPGDEK